MRKKALIINPYWDSLGGGERYTATLVRYLLDRGWLVDIYWSTNFSSQLKDRFGVDVGLANWLNKTYSPPQTIKYDLLFWVSDGSLPVSFCKKTIIHLQFPFLNIAGRGFKNFLKSRIYTFVVNSGFTKTFIDKEFSVSSQVVYPPIDTSLFMSAAKTNSIVYVGRFSNLTQHKGQEVLIKSFKNISRSIPGWKLILAGGTSVGTNSADLTKLKKQAKGYPIEFVTNPSFDQLRKLFSSSKIFWSASGFGVDQNSQPIKTEHFGITVVEAMAAGSVPVIVNAGGHPEIVEDKVSGFLWATTQELESTTLDLITQNQFAKYSQAAQVRSKIFDVTEFNNRLDRVIKV
ncbi:hypothetical protein A2397_04135 [Candidatus Amesbacteria bacterium RIFOXYB1_FULL_44_23]|uniref:Glycosyl transferase family 1 domain-containing protein n=1 Tax=Candidatus Amesbacteria bacterium RIFOXYB1_FULL_44_23 TaxID=1797263 RepID=A0A1F4ZR26_9BACT|nr:MAG: hypothetical protein A2397_04135 [Candidatus Amesbacteria bacterium RIFOXYB1_FULL_44_23]